MGNVYDGAYAVEKDLREDSTFKLLAQSFEAVKNNETAAAVFSEFTSNQMLLQQKQMNGEEITEEDITAAQAVIEKAQANELIKTLMDREQAVSGILQEINGIITKPLQELYRDVQN